MIVATTENQCDMSNLWLRGRSDGRNECSSFGKHIAHNIFKAFFADVTYCFCDKKWRFKDKRDKPQDTHLPELQKYNDKKINTIFNDNIR